MDGCADTAGSLQQPPGLEVSEGAVAEGPDSGVVVVERLVLLRLFMVVVGRRPEGGAGALVGAVRPPHLVRGTGRRLVSRGGLVGDGLAWAGVGEVVQVVGGVGGPAAAVRRGGCPTAFRRRRTAAASGT